MATTDLRNILVTGGCGFIGSNFINEAFDTWPNVRLIDYDNLGAAANVNNIREDVRNSGRYHLVTGNLNSQELLKRTMQKYVIDGVVHFAAESNVDFSFENKYSTVDNNINGTLNLLEAIRATPSVRRFLNISTDEVYGDSEGEEFEKTEEMAMSPTSPYSATKAGAEMLVMAYIVAYKIPGVRARMCNVYGDNQHDTKVVPKFIQVAKRGDPFPLHGDGHQQRTWLHAKDAVRCLRRILVDGKIGEIYNVATENEVSILDLAKMINKVVADVLGKPESPFRLVYPEDRPYNDKRYHIGYKKFEAEFGEKVKSISFEDGIRQTVEAYLLRPKPIQVFGSVLVFGGKGWIGQQFKELLAKKGLKYFDAKTRPGDDLDRTVEDEIINIAPSHVISLIGRTHGPGTPNIDYLEGGPDKLKLNGRDNLFGPWLLGHLCTKLGIHFTYIGSGCLFNYDKLHPVGGKGFTESDVPNYFGSSYSVMKGFTDRMFHHMSGSVLNVRMRMPVSYDDHPRNLITKIASYPKIVNLPNSVTVMPELLPILLGLMEQRFSGTINLVNPDPALHAETLTAYRDLVDSSHRFEILNLETDDAKALLKKRSNCNLETTLIQQLAPGLTHGPAAMRKAVEEMSKLGRHNRKDVMGA